MTCANVQDCSFFRTSCYSYCHF